MDEQGAMMSSGQDFLESYHLPRPLPLWLNPNYAKHIVKGNFMTLSARPKTVEQGEWIAHQGMLANPCAHNHPHSTLMLMMSCPQLLSTIATYGTLCV